jgi:glucose-1-phosphate cytidylyltransferase
MRINGGYFVFKNKIFDYIQSGEDLVDEPFQRLITNHELIAYKYDGFWATMDTHKEMQELNGLYDTGLPPWAIWRGASR